MLVRLYTLLRCTIWNFPIVFSFLFLFHCSAAIVLGKNMILKFYFRILFKNPELCNCFVSLFLYMADFPTVFGYDISLLVNKLWNLFAFLLNAGEATETAMSLWGQKLLE